TITPALAAVLLVCATGQTSGSEPAGPSRGAFSIQSWRTEDGLPNDMVNDVAQDREGYLWVATNAGVARFDGVRFQAFDKQTTPEPGGDACSRLLVTRAGALWIGSVGGSLTKLVDGRFTSYGKKDGLEFQYPTTLFEDSEGKLWAGTNQGPLRET